MHGIKKVNVTRLRKTFASFFPIQCRSHTSWGKIHEGQWQEKQFSLVLWTSIIDKADDDHWDDIGGSLESNGEPRALENGRPWCSQTSYRGWLKNRTEQNDDYHIVLVLERQHKESKALSGKTLVSNQEMVISLFSVRCPAFLSVLWHCPMSKMKDMWPVKKPDFFQTRNNNLFNSHLSTTAKYTTSLVILSISMSTACFQKQME